MLCRTGTFAYLHTQTPALHAKSRLVPPERPSEGDKPASDEARTSPNRPEPCSATTTARFPIGSPHRVSRNGPYSRHSGPRSGPQLSRLQSLRSWSQKYPSHLRCFSIYDSGFPHQKWRRRSQRLRPYARVSPVWQTFDQQNCPRIGGRRRNQCFIPRPLHPPTAPAACVPDHAAPRLAAKDELIVRI